MTQTRKQISELLEWALPTFGEPISKIRLIGDDLYYKNLLIEVARLYGLRLQEWFPEFGEPGLVFVRCYSAHPEIDRLVKFVDDTCMALGAHDDYSTYLLSLENKLLEFYPVLVLLAELYGYRDIAKQDCGRITNYFFVNSANSGRLS